MSEETRNAKWADLVADIDVLLVESHNRVRSLKLARQIAEAKIKSGQTYILPDRLRTCAET